MFLQSIHLYLMNKSDSHSNQATFKLIMIGDSGSGKSCLLIRFLKDYFIENHSVTVGVEFATKKLSIDDNYSVKLQIWDTAGQQNFRSLVKSFYRNSSAVALVYNITNRKSFNSLDEWLIEARENSPQNSFFILIGTHLDLDNQREVELEEGEKFMKDNGIILFFETSAKTSENVNRAFEELGKQLFLHYIKNRNLHLAHKDQNSQIQLQKQQQVGPDSRSCC